MHDTLATFSKPYFPNDGHGPGVPLPDDVHAMLMALDGKQALREKVMIDIESLWPGAIVIDHGDFLGIEHENHRWWAIGYVPVIR